MKNTAEIGLVAKDRRQTSDEATQQQSQRRLELLRGTLEKAKTRARAQAQKDKAREGTETVINQSYGEVRLPFCEVDPNNHTADITHNIRVANRELLREVFRRNRPLYEARQGFVNPPRFDHARVGKANINPEEVYGKMREKLELYIRLAETDPDYQRVLNAFRHTLPENFYVYRGQVGNAPARGFENYSVSPEQANIFAMEWGSLDEQYQPGANVVKDLVKRDQVIALGLGNVGELIIDTQSDQPQLAKAA